MEDGKASGMEEIVRLAARGDGVTAAGHFVPGAAPGDRVDSAGRLVPGPHHTTPPCRHFGDCGGCQLQHVDDEALLAFATARVLEPLERLHIVPGELWPAHLSPPASRRRATLRATRRGGTVHLGFNALREHRIVDLAECPVLHPDLVRLFEPLRRLLAPVLHERAALSITLVQTLGGVDVLLSNLAAPDLPRIEGLAEFASRQQLARLSIRSDNGVETIAAPNEPAVRMGGVIVPLPPGAFLQATADGEAVLVESVRSMLGEGRRIADLFAGCGTFTFPLLADGRRLLAAEGSAAALAALSGAARRAGLAVEPTHRDLFRNPLSAAELQRFDAVVLDPPRAGAEAQMRALAESRVGRVVAVSCNPATFARDAALLVAGGFRLLALRPVAQFRWSTHVELVAQFSR